MSHTGDKSTTQKTQQGKFLKSKANKPRCIENKKLTESNKNPAGSVTKKPAKQKEECQRWRLGSMEHGGQVSAQETQEQTSMTTSKGSETLKLRTYNTEEASTKNIGNLPNYTRDSPNLEKDTDIPAPETLRTPNRHNERRNLHDVEMLKIHSKENHLQSYKGK